MSVQQSDSKSNIYMPVQLSIKKQGLLARPSIIWHSKRSRTRGRRVTSSMSIDHTAFKTFWDERPRSHLLMRRGAGTGGRTPADDAPVMSSSQGRWRREPMTSSHKLNRARQPTAAAPDLAPECRVEPIGHSIAARIQRRRLGPAVPTGEWRGEEKWSTHDIGKKDTDTLKPPE